LGKAASATKRGGSGELGRRQGIKTRAGLQPQTGCSAGSSSRNPQNGSHERIDKQLQGDVNAILARLRVPGRDPPSTFGAIALDCRDPE
jgi:hypothetical protein